MDERKRDGDDNQLNAAGTLYLVGTPIGNLGDLPPRVREVLAAVDLVAAEDTRRTLRLCTHLGLRKHLESYHEHNWRSKGPYLVGLLKQGKNIALVSDAGMPCISDPGEELVRSCAAEKITVTVIPGPSAAIVALAGSGLATGHFVFEGFLPAAGRNRKTRLDLVAAEERTCILYEAPHRLLRTLDDLAAAGLGDRRLTLARELTKRHETFLRMTVSEAQAYYGQTEPRGEFVLVLEGREAWRQRLPVQTGSSAEDGEDLVQALLSQLLKDGLSCRDAARLAAEQTGRKKNDLYQRALLLQEQLRAQDGG